MILKNRKMNNIEVMNEQSRYNFHIARCPGRAGAAQRRVFLNLELDKTNLIACFWGAASDQADGMSFFFACRLDASN